MPYNLSPDNVKMYSTQLEDIALVVAGAQTEAKFQPAPGFTLAQLAYALREALVSAEMYPSEPYHKGLAKKVRISVDYETQTLVVRVKGARGQALKPTTVFSSPMKLMSHLIGHPDIQEIECTLQETADDDHESVVAAIKQIGWNVTSDSGGITQGDGTVWYTMKLRRSRSRAHADDTRKQLDTPTKGAFDILDRRKKE